MKKVILTLFPLLALAAIFLVYNKVNQKPTEFVNEEKKPLAFKENEVQCPQCNMFLVEKKYTAQAVTQDSKTHFFDDPGCLVLWIEANHKNQDNQIVKWVYTIDTKRWIRAKSAFYSIDDKTPMHYGFGAYESKKDSRIEYSEMKLKMLRGENMTNPKIRKKILGS